MLAMDRVMRHYAVIQIFSPDEEVVNPDPGLLPTCACSVNDAPSPITSTKHLVTLLIVAPLAPWHPWHFR